jgi:hypothetical protein
MLMAFASIVILSSQPYGTHDNTSASDDYGSLRTLTLSLSLSLRVSGLECRVISNSSAPTAQKALCISTTKNAQQILSRETIDVTSENFNKLIKEQFSGRKVVFILNVGGTYSGGTR